MQESARKSRRLLKTATLMLCVIFGLINPNCTQYNPILYPGYDVLNPNEEVRKNPLGWVIVGEDGSKEVKFEGEISAGNYVIVNEAFSIWVYDLKREIKRLRRLITEAEHEEGFIDNIPYRPISHSFAGGKR